MDTQLSECSSGKVGNAAPDSNFKADSCCLGIRPKATSSNKNKVFICTNCPGNPCYRRDNPVGKRGVCPKCARPFSNGPVSKRSREEESKGDLDCHFIARPSKNILGKRVAISGVADAEKEELRKRVKELEEDVKRL